MIRKAIGESGTTKMLRELVDKGGKVTLSLSMYTRGVDGPGSSQDLPQWQLQMTDLDQPQLERMPKTSTIASGFAVKMRFIVDKGDEVASKGHARVFQSIEPTLGKPPSNRHEPRSSN